ncbi:SKA complex subunit 1-like [Ptychodera flava]|uniref:SKA complex subunit 1-like n=1 Tax=Ptychodera flava TaxID=63121 RepID=UPI00396A8ABA
MDSNTLEELGQHFCDKVEGIKKCMQIHDCVNNDNCQQLLQSIHMQLIGAEDVISHLKQAVASERQKLAEAQESMKEYKEFLDNIHYMSTHLPSRLPGKPTSQIEEKTRVNKGVLQSRASENRTEEVQPAVTSKYNAKKRFPKTEYLTVDEYQEIPKYMKGRLSYDMMNNVVDGINKVIEYKYKLKAQPRNTVGENNMKKRKQWKQQENKETQGLHFFVDDDYKKYSGLKLDKATGSVFTILRHLGRLTEVRGGGCTRYCLSSY